MAVNQTRKLKILKLKLCKKKVTKSDKILFHKSVPNSRNKKVEIFQRVIFLLHFLSGFPWKSIAPTQPNQNCFTCYKFGGMSKIKVQNVPNLQKNTL